MHARDGRHAVTPDGKTTSYVSLMVDSVTEDSVMGAITATASDGLGYHPDGVNVLYGDGHVDWLEGGRVPPNLGR